MILTKKLKIKVIGKTINYYRSLGYDVCVNGTIDIDIIHLTPKSRYKITVECDVCGCQKLLSYQKYTKNINSHGYYTCSQKCSVDKCKLTSIDRFGVDSPMKTEEIKNKGKNTKLSRYGDENYNNINKMKSTNMEKYGVENYNNKDKCKKTMIEKYGVENPMELEINVKKMKDTKIKMGINLPDESLTKFRLYKRNVTRTTRRNKKELFEKWSGFDHYDNEFIKENTSLDSMDRMYPTIDHKISIFLGFINNIDYNIIGGIDNLCITKKYINSIKGKRTKYDNFISDSIH